MIVTGMSFDEVLHELHTDMPYAFEASERKENKVRRLIQKATRFPYQVHSYITTKRKNRWLLMWNADNRNAIGDSTKFSMACIVNQENGRMVFFPTIIGDVLHTVVFLPHFFARYAQRTGIDLTGEELIRRFLEGNPDFSFHLHNEMVNDKQYKIVASGTCNEGVALGYQLKGNAFLFKTFIRYDMSKGNQADIFRACEEARKKHINEIL